MVFAALVAYTWLARPGWTVATVRLAVDAGLLAIALVSLAIGHAAAEYVEAIPIWVDVAVSVAAFVGAVWFSRWYPAAVRRRFTPAAP